MSLLVIDAFSSVQLVEALLKRGLDYVGTKKRKSTGYPYEYLREETTKLQSGEHVAATTKMRLQNGEGRDILGLDDKTSDSHINTIISTVGSTESGVIVKCRKRTLPEMKSDITEREQPEATVHQPAILEAMQKYNHAVDDNNHMRQGLQKIEEHWKTHKPHIRIFSTIIGVVCANNYLGYRYEKDLYE